MEKRYDPKAVEPKWTEYWEEHDIYAHDPGKGSYTIDTPPPTVSGRMHIGHACSYTQEDFYARFFRMKTGKVFYPFGTDDNGLPTERLVERKKKVKARKMSRKEFRELCHETIKELKPDFIQDWKDIGMSCDFKTTYSTISEEVQRISQKSFLDLYEKGHVYREESPVAWCVKCQTAIAQAEFENIDKQSRFNDIIFEADGRELVISTTRPELIPACVAIAAHPDDERYKDLPDKATVPLLDYEVDIIYDKDVDKEKGSGLMMVCTFGDKEDVEKWHRHDLPLRAIFTEYGKLNDLAGKYEDMKIKEARKKILEDLEGQGLLKDQKEITHAVNVHERCGTPIEFLKTYQWYVRVLDIKDELLEAGKKIQWHPAFMRKRYEHWVENLGWDWCISRQRYFGVPFPVWYDEDGEIIVADEPQLPVDPFTDRPEGYDGEVEPEEDVMDTWATSSVTPHIALGWDRAEEMLPMTLRPQAHDIIRTWAFYTIVKAHLNNDTVPWSNIAVSGYVMDPHGEKMSKSKGNVVDPRKVLEKYSADAIRYWAASAKLGDDIPYQEKELVTGKKTINKLWNASKFVLMNVDARLDRPHLEPFDEWILSKYNAVVKECTGAFEQYDHSKARHLIDGFFWNDFCDDYLEIVKGRLYGDDPAGKHAAQYTLLTVLEGVLKMFAPIMPYVTEEIYQHLPDHGKSIHTSDWPEAGISDEEQVRLGDMAAQVIRDVRRYKTDRQMSMRAELRRVTVHGPGGLERFREDLQNVTKAEEILFESAGEVGTDVEG